MVLITIVNGVYKPTNITAGPHSASIFHITTQKLPKSQVFLSRIRCIQAQPHGLPGIAIAIGAHDALSGLTTHELRGVPTRERGSEKRTCQWIGGKKCRNPMEAPHISWENQWFPVKMFPYNQSIALWVPIRCRLGYAGCPWAYRPSVLSCEWGSDPAWDQPGQKNGEKRCYLQSCPVPMALNYTMWGHVGPFAIAKLVRL